MTGGRPTEFAFQQFERIFASQGKERLSDISREMKHVMFDQVGIFRTGAGMQQALAKVRELKERLKNVRVEDHGKVFNTNLMNTWELGNLLDLAEVVTVCAINRTESRGAHARDDFPKRDDVNWLKHTLTWVKEGEIKISYKPVVVTKYQPKERVY